MVEQVEPKHVLIQPLEQLAVLPLPLPLQLPLLLPPPDPVPPLDCLFYLIASVGLRCSLFRLLHIYPLV